MKKRIEPGTVIFDPRKGRYIIIRDINNLDKYAVCSVSYIHVDEHGEYTTTDWTDENISFKDLELMLKEEMMNE